MSGDVKPKIIKNLDEEIYHSQSDLEVPHFSASTAKTIIDKSPYHAWWQHPKLGGHRKDSTAAMDKGTIIHNALLGGGPEIVVLEYDNFRKKEAQQARDEINAAGKIPILSKNMEEINAMIEVIKPQIIELVPDFFDDERETELSVLWEYNGVKTLSRLDWTKLHKGRIIDVKSCANASPEYLDRQIYNLCYDIQEAAYTMCGEKIVPELAGRFDFQFLFIETDEPYAVSLVETDASYKEVGKFRWHKAAEEWRIGLESGVWKGYGKGYAYAPAYALKNAMVE